MGYYFSQKGSRAKIVIGKDTRLSSYTLEYAVAAGVTASGGDAYIMHVTTTPSVSYVARTEGFDCGVMISASHNAYADNGIKLLNSHGEKMERGVLDLIEDYIDGKLFSGNSALTIPFAEGEKVGRTVDFVAGRNRYIGHLISLAAFSCKGMKIGLDCANGASFKIAKSVFDALGATVFCVGAEPDGVNVNEGCGSTNPQKLVELVKENSLDVGFAFDGDADRCICVDERGCIADGDCILYLTAKHLKAKGELIGNRIVATVMSNGGLKESLAAEGISVCECPVGDSFVYAEMCKTGATLGGEQSGHVIFGKLENTGDGLVTAITVTEAMTERGEPLSKLLNGFIPKPQYTLNVRVRDKAVINSEEVIKAIERAKGQLGADGRLIVRASGTEEIIRITAECGTKDRCERVCKDLELAIKKGDGE